MSKLTERQLMMHCTVRIRNCTVFRPCSTDQRFTS